MSTYEKNDTENKNVETINQNDIEIEGDVKEKSNVNEKKSSVKEPYENISNHMGEIITETLQRSKIYLLFGFFLFYLVIFLSSSAIFGKGYSKYFFDIIAFLVIGAYIFHSYRKAKLTEDGNILQLIIDNIIDFYDDPINVSATFLFIVCFYGFSLFLRIPADEERPFAITFLEIFSWLVIASIIYHNTLKHFFNIDLMDDLREWKHYIVYRDDIEAPMPLTPEPKEEVFNIGNNLYTYDDAQAICKAHNARLATYDEIEGSYNNGAEWCNYGWSANQMALFPTQKSTWNELQQSDKHKNSCGRPGINGGYFDNPNIKFGVNCFGYKSQPTDKESDMMETKKERPYPQTEKEKEMEEKIEYWKKNGKNVMYINSFNRNKWSRY